MEALIIDGMIAPVPVRVECHAGFKGEEYPKAVHLEGQRREVIAILDRWYQSTPDPGRPAAEYFKARTAQGVLILKYDPAAHAWFLMAEL
jgi:hypothetical protein